ncbi:MAG: PAS domain-containing protein, partial [Acidimicrobiales bacterium]
LEGRVATWNPAAERLYGWAAGEIVGRPWAELTPGDGQTEVSALVEAAIEGRSVRAVRTLQRHRDGTTVPVAVTVAALRGDAGGIVGLSAIVHDVTEEVLAAERRAAAEARFQAAFEQSSHGMALADLALGVTAVNPAVCELLGRTGAELLGDGWATFLHPDEDPPDTWRWRGDGASAETEHPPNGERDAGDPAAGATNGGGAAGGASTISRDLPATLRHERRFLRRDGTVVTTVID